MMYFYYGPPMQFLSGVDSLQEPERKIVSLIIDTQPSERHPGYGLPRL